MEKRRPRGSTDKLAAVKAAAWAWYQHGSGSGSDGTPAREYVAARPHHVPRPSRYKLEAMRSKTKEGVLPLIDDNFKPQSNRVSLLDAYEIRSISRHLDSLIDQYSIGDHGDDHKDNQDFRLNEALISDVDDHHSMVMEKRKKKKNSRKMVNLRGLWIRHAAAMCSTREGVVETAAIWNGRRQQTEGSRRVLPVVMAATCRPWNNIMHSRG